MLSKNAREGVHSIVKLLAISLGGAPHGGASVLIGGVQKNNRMGGGAPPCPPTMGNPAYEQLVWDYKRVNTDAIIRQLFFIFWCTDFFTQNLMLEDEKK